MTLKVAVELLVFPPLVLEKVKLMELYAESRGTGLGGAPDEDELVVHEKVVVEVEAVDVDEVVELFVAELELDEDGLFDVDEEEVNMELEVLIAEVAEEEADVDELLLLNARYAAVPPTASTIMTTTAITACAMPRFRLVIKDDSGHSWVDDISNCPRVLSVGGSLG